MIGRQDWTARVNGAGRTAWRNWAGTATAEPLTAIRPRDRTEITGALVDAQRRGRKVRPLGSGHSFTEVGSPDAAVALDLSAWTGIERADPGTGLVDVRAGTPLRQLNQELAERGLAMTNLGDIDRQTLAGALATGTHGTGAAFGGLATQVEALEIALADGSVRRCDAEQNPELFQAARVGLGALGVITSVTLRCVPAFGLAADERSAPLDSVLERFDELVEQHDHLEFYWFPHGSRALVKANDRLPAGSDPRPLGPVRRFAEYEVVENWAFGALCRTGRQLPRLVPALTRLAGRAWSARSYSDRSDRVFVTGRAVRFVECEYAVPLAELPAVLRELRSAVERLERPVMFPVEVRVAAADDIWLSTAHQRATAYIAVHQYSGMPYREWFDAFEAITRAAGGRPHWGKLHRCAASALRASYPRFDDFLRVRADVDPERTFTNRYLARVLDER
jgi:L-gulonolactone oxidase